MVTGKKLLFVQGIFLGLLTTSYLQAVTISNKTAGVITILETKVEYERVVSAGLNTKSIISPGQDWKQDGITEFHVIFPNKSTKVFTDLHNLEFIEIDQKKMAEDKYVYFNENKFKSCEFVGNQSKNRMLVIGTDSHVENCWMRTANGELEAVLSSFMYEAPSAIKSEFGIKVPKKSFNYYTDKMLQAAFLGVALYGVFVNASETLF